MNTVKIAVIADLHYGRKALNPARRCEISDILLQRTIYRLNRLVKPDITLILGDILDDGQSPEAENNLNYIKTFLDKLDSQYIIIPGNHDCDTDLFYRVFPRPDDLEEICGVRFLSFIDREEPGYNANRSTSDLNLLRIAGNNFSGPIVTLQHVCLFPAGRSDIPYNYTNADEIIKVMKETGVILSLSGHYHKGADTIRDGNITFINAPGMCEAPFPYSVINIVDGHIQRERQDLAMVEYPDLIDSHMHSQLAYCSDHMDVKSTIALAEDFGLGGIIFTEHSGQLYFDETRYWNNKCLEEGINSANDKNNRMDNYLQFKSKYENRTVRFGLEVDCDFKGNMLLKPEDRSHFDFLIGAVHSLPGLSRSNKPEKRDCDDFLFLIEKLLTRDIDVLAHPFRVFKRSGWTSPEELFLPTAELLKKYNTAAEINFHTNEPPVGLIRACLNHGVKFSLASDAHHLAEIGDFSYHLDLLERAGFDGSLYDILAPSSMTK